MELDNLFGLPAHPLLVHAVVVLVPLTAVGAVAAAFWPAARARVGWLVAAVAVGDVVLLPFVTGSGERLEERLGENPLVQRHAQMGDHLLPWAAGLAVMAVAIMLIDRYAARAAAGDGHGDGPGAARRTVWHQRAWAGVAALVLTSVVATGTLVEVVRIGHSGAKASWSDVANSGGEREEGDGH